ncbi:uncharacterized protein EAF02_011508 [Botrytis sinoallii]|uniref:uncharacterized protein n=1 Tax=Botrytis sinoallii TaxID=1463999 RepID=UPI001901FFDF|nr:uncharacterized protein EAF02_011508 [Botrytis sinoallii]KAF7856249.1 hypothetical protein EAF02_011508 [Botrytis sinoallii]
MYKNFPRITIARNLAFGKERLRFKYCDGRKSGLRSGLQNRMRSTSCDLDFDLDFGLDFGLGFGLELGVCDCNRGIVGLYTHLWRKREREREREREERLLGKMENVSVRDGAGEGEAVEMEMEMGGGGDARGGKGGKGGRGGMGKGKGRGAAAGGNGTGGNEKNREMLVSKALSKLLRHAAESEGVRLDGEGFARLDLVMQWPRLKSLKPTFADIRTAVTDNAKQRFSMKPNPSLPEPPSPSSESPEHWMIRANQGHSIAIDSAALLVPITLEAGNVPETCVHGTYFAFYDEIVNSGGLKKMGRNHVHFGTGVPEDGGVVSGMRGDAEVLIYVDVKRCLVEEPQMKWWVSENGVVLTEGDKEGVVGTRFWKRVEGRREGGLLWVDGVKVADLEEGLRNRKAPMGKGGRGGGGGRGRGGRGGGRGRGKEGRGGRGGGRGGKSSDGNTEIGIEETNL